MLDSPKILSNLRSLAFEVNGKGKLGSCYLAGPMTGLPEFNRHAFEEVARILRICGWTVYSPVENDKEDGVELGGTTGHETFDYRRAMAWDLAQVCKADCVIVMPGWEESTGANLEVYVALAVGTPVFTYLSQRRITSLEEGAAVAPCKGGATPSSGIEDGSAPGDSLTPEQRSTEGPVCAEAGSSTTLPEDSAARKSLPITTGVLDYFPAAIAAVADVSKKGNDKHNPGEPLHHARGKSMDHADCIARHLTERGEIDRKTGVRHSAELAWRALAMLQQELEDAGEAPLARGASVGT